MKKQIVHKVAGGWLHKRGIGVRRGFGLLRSRDVSVGSKLAGLTIGIVVTATVLVLEIPIEGLIAVVAPIIGLTLDFVADGVEAVLLPLVVTCLYLCLVNPPSQTVGLVQSE